MPHESTQPLDYNADHGDAKPESILQSPERLWREQPKEITAEVQGNYPKFKQNKRSENWIFSANKSLNVFWRSKIWKIIDREPAGVVIQNLVESDQ